ncbi:MAG: hypothetical protein ASARMPREDX12_008455 [Alectoria sarmentosa]|nr:MAG: hypothetical protein ASARMPREDX12_008455 [Alectoria sarmentosa]
MTSLRAAKIMRVAVVGAGPGGVAASKYLLAEGCFDTIDIFEQQASFGGVWNYSNDSLDKIDIPQTNPHQPLDEPIWHSVPDQNGVASRAQHATFVSPMYEHLETNIPHTIMKFSDMPSLEDHQLFPSREVVVQYLEDYAEDVRHLVSFQTQVMDICQTQPGAHQIRLKDLQTNTIYEKIYDAIVVANGHYTVPSIPNIKGIKEWNHAHPGVISHTKSYRKSGPFADKKVIVVGNAASGTDIASQIGTVCKHPLLISQRSESVVAFAAGYKENVQEIAEFLPDSHGTRAVRFTDSRVEEEVDAVLFATGYYYSFPFLSSLESKIISTGERVKHMYKHLFYIDDPTIAFVGLPLKIIPFRTVEGQGAVVARVWANRLELPSTLEMNRWEEDVIAELGAGKAFHVLPFPKDFEYHNELVDWAMRATGRGGKTPTPWSAKETWARERFPAIKKAFADKGDARHGIKTLQELGKVLENQFDILNTQDFWTMAV